ncbi:hypothetical protein AA18895_1309 [Acetobacter ghanensis DSM 18895]|nr:hypothetical protein AA18895_1309 [Acetobacter ghanensis DSM 18895]
MIIMRRLFSVACLSLLAACATQAPRKYIVFFSNQSAELDQAGQDVVAQVAQEADKHPSRVVRVEGYAGAGKDLSADAWVAIQRAKAVTAKLQEDGVPSNRIVQTPRAPSNMEGMVVGARRVEIELTSP